VSQRLTVVMVTLFMLVGLPAYAYADPSGGAFFQVLMPMLAAIWAMWLIFANRVRRTISVILQKLRGVEPSKPTL
jgi:hypothetical protein